MMALCIIFGIITVISLTSLFLILDDLKEIIKQIDYKNKTNSQCFFCKKTTAENK